MTNRELLEKAPPGSIIFFKKLSFVDSLIRLAQSMKSGRPSEWSHCAIKTHDNTLLESDFYLRGPRVCNGAMESSLRKYYSEQKVGNIASIECLIDPATVRAVVTQGRSFVKRRVRYAVAGLLGTLLNIVRLKLSSSGQRLQAVQRESNIFFQRDAMYCVHFVLACFSTAGVELLPHVNQSVSTVEDLFRTKVRQSFMIKRRIA